jgi:hypothetical protein
MLCCAVLRRLQVIIGSPTVISEDLLRTFNISLVVRGSVTETRTHNSGQSDRCGCSCRCCGFGSVYGAGSSQNISIVTGLGLARSVLSTDMYAHAAANRHSHSFV